MLSSTETQIPPRGPLQFYRFLVAGAANSALTFILYEILNLFWPYWLSFTISFAAGIGIAAAVNARWVFFQTLTPYSLACFAGFYLLSYASSLAILMLLVDGFGVPSALAPLGVIAVMLPINFFGSRFVLKRGGLS